MSYTVTENGLIEVTTVTKLYDQTLLNVVHFKLHFTGGAVDADGPSAINHLDSLLNVAGGLTGKMAACQHQDVIWTGVRYQWIHPTRYAFVLKDPSPAGGAVALTALPPNDGVAITKRAERAGRHFVSTFHLGGMAAEWFTAGGVNGVGIAQLNALRDELKVTYTYAPAGEQYIPVIFNRVAPADSPVVVGTELQATARVMRRRTVGLGI